MKGFCEECDETLSHVQAQNFVAGSETVSCRWSVLYYYLSQAVTMFVCLDLLTGWQYGFLNWLPIKKSLDLPSPHLLPGVTIFLSVCALYASPSSYST